MQRHYVSRMRLLQGKSLSFEMLSEDKSPDLSTERFYVNVCDKSSVILTREYYKAL